MDIIIANNSDTPIYEQIYESISTQILSGALGAEEILPSIRALAKDLRISVITVKSAYEMLERDGLIVTRQGKGCFVCPHRNAELEDKKLKLAEERLKKELPYYRRLELSEEEMLSLVRKLYKK